MSPNRRQIVLRAVDAYEARLVRYARRLLGDEHAAHDAVQHAFVKLLDVDVVELEPRIGPWLYAVCRNRAMDLLRQRKRETPAPSPALVHERELQGAVAAGAGRDRASTTERDAPASREHDPARQIEQADLHEQVQRAVADLPLHAREPLALWAEGFTYREIAEVLGQSEGTLRVVVHRALTALRAHPTVKALAATL